MCISLAISSQIDDFSLGEKLPLSACLHIRQPIGLGGFLVQPRRHLRHYIAAMGGNGADGDEVRAVAGAGDGQRRACGRDTADLQMLDGIPAAGGVDDPDGDALPRQAVGVGLWLHISAPRTHAPHPMRFAP